MAWGDTQRNQVHTTCHIGRTRILYGTFCVVTAFSSFLWFCWWLSLLPKSCSWASWPALLYRFMWKSGCKLKFCHHVAACCCIQVHCRELLCDHDYRNKICWNQQVPFALYTLHAPPCNDANSVCSITKLCQDPAMCPWPSSIFLRCPVRCMTSY